MLESRDYTLIVDCSLSMSVAHPPGNISRWQAIQDSILALAQQCEKFDPDGLTVYIFSDRFERYDSIAAGLIPEILQECKPAGCADLARVLEDAFQNYFARKAVGRTQPNGVTFVVVTAGEMSDRQGVMDAIIGASQQADWEEELALSLIQVGDDAEITQFFKVLDDDLQSRGAKFDIVDAVTMADLEDMTLTEVLINAIID